MYVNGSSTPVTVLQPPLGAYQNSLSTAQLILGYNPTLAYGLLGGLKDIRIYNRILSATEVATLYNSGTPLATVGPTSGLVFQGPVVRTPELALYTGQTLTANTPVLDNIIGYVGTIAGSPTGASF